MPRNSNNLLEAKDLIFIWRLIIKNIFILILLPVIAYGIGYIYTYRLSNIYGAKVQLLLKSGDTYDYQDPIYKGLGAYGVYMDVQNQIRILKSKDLLSEVIDKLTIDASYYIVGRLKKKEVFGTLPFECEFTVLNSQLFEKPIEVQIIDKDTYELRYHINDQGKSLKCEFNTLIRNEDVHISLNRKYTFDEENIDIIRSSDYELILHSKDHLINRYKSALTIENIEYTSILDVSITDPIQSRAKMFLDTLAWVYVDYSTRTQLEINNNTVENIDRQIDTIQHLIGEKEQELLLFKDINSVLSPDKEESEYFNNYIFYTAEKRDILKKIHSLDALKDYLTDLSDERILPPSFFIEESDFYLKEAVNNVRKLQVDLELRKNSENNENFNIVTLKKEISMLTSDILKYLENLKTALLKEVTDVENLINNFENEIKKLPKSEQGIMNIQRELDVKNKMYLFLLEKKTNTLITRAGIIPQVQIIENSSSLGIVQPNKSKLRRTFVLAGVVIALLIAFVRKFVFERITTVKELSDITSIPVIGGLPYMKNMEASLVVLESPKSQITESFRTVRTNLSFLGKSEGVKRILVSSYFPSEGKTFSSSNLATLISMGDKKVLLLDFDLHKPKVYKAFELDNSKGISTVLSGKNKVEEVLHKNVVENLDVLTSGPIPPNPSELILKDSTKDLFDWAESIYDYIIIDTPPFGLLNDSMSLLKFADVFTIIMNSSTARRRGVYAIEEMLESKENISVGLVLNGVKQSGIMYYYAKYSYKYTYSRYSYGYGGYGESYDSDYEN